MKICILEVAGEDMTGVPADEQDWPTVILPYLQSHDCELHQIEKSTAEQQVTALVERGFDVFINLCDGSWDSDAAGIEVVQTLERLHVPFTGATSPFYDPTREEMKHVCRAHGVAVPDYVLARKEADIHDAADRLTMPLIVKHPNGYSSVGVTRDSYVTSRSRLIRRAKRALRAYGSALIEEFIAGREFTVLVAENAADTDNPVVYDPVEFVFPQGETFKHYDLKWVEYKGMTCVPCKDPVLTERLKEISRRMFVGLHGTGYGRCDIRMDEDGELFMLEINANCGVFYAPEDASSADFILLNDPGGHTEFLNVIMKAALNRHEQSLDPLVTA